MTLEDYQLILGAAAWAANRHAGQTRKDRARTPYVVHPIEVASTLAAHGVDNPRVLAAALLHDTVEDTDTTVEELAAQFGWLVAKMVSEVTDDRALPKAERKRAQVAHVPACLAGSKQIKLADKLNNLRCMQAEAPLDRNGAPWPAERVRGYAVWARAVLAGAAGTLPSLEAEVDRTLAHWGVLPIGAAGGHEAELEAYYASLE